jgi:ABC-type dipeptide/oligopeptide/nickel transport system permease component
MSAYVLRRVASLVVVMLGVTLFVFAISKVTPGDYVAVRYGDYGTVEQREALRRQLGLDQSVVVQYLRFVGRAVQGDLGVSHRSGRPVVTELAVRLPVTLRLALATILVASVLGVAAGVLAAVRQGTPLDYGTITIALLGVSIPSFWLGLMLQVLFGYQLGWLPVAGSGDWRFYVLPAISLGSSAAGGIARYTRSAMLEVVRLDYVRTAQAKGLARATVVWKHALRNALIPVMSVLGLQFAGLMGGAIITESIFALPGIGRLSIEALSARDVPVVQGVVLLSAAIIVTSNLLVDLGYTLVDPRIRYD